MNSRHFTDHGNADLSYDPNSVWKHDLVSGPNFRCCLQEYYHLHVFVLFLLLSIKCLTQKTWEGYIGGLFFTVACILIFPKFWLQIKYFHYKIPPDSFVTEFKCWQLMQKELLCNNCCKTIFLPRIALLAKFHWAFLNAFLPLSCPPHASEGHLTFHLSWVIVVLLPTVTITAFHLSLQLCWTLFYVNTSSNICKVLSDPSA